jgi:hypothetical protein
MPNFRSCVKRSIISGVSKCQNLALQKREAETSLKKGLPYISIVAIGAIMILHPQGIKIKWKHREPDFTLSEYNKSVASISIVNAGRAPAILVNTGTAVDIKK